MGEMLNQDKDDEDEEWLAQSKQKPDINKLDVGCGWQLGGDGLIEGVHDQHGGDCNWDTCLEMFRFKVDSYLEYNESYFIENNCSRLPEQ